MVRTPASCNFIDPKKIIIDFKTVKAGESHFATDNFLKLQLCVVDVLKNGLTDTKFLCLKTSKAVQQYVVYDVRQSINNLATMTHKVHSK